MGAVALAAVAVALVSGGSGTDPRAPRLLAIPGIGEGGAVVVVDSLGSVVGERRAGPEGRAAERWAEGARPLGPGAPAWARQMYRRSLLALRALTDWRSGAVIAGARQGWAYVWPRDAAAVALAFAAVGDRREARRVARFLSRLDLGAAARFYPDGTPVPAREAQGDAAGWVDVAARAAGLRAPVRRSDWRDRADYQEKAPGDYLGNAIASPPADGPKSQLRVHFSAHRRLMRKGDTPNSGVDSAAAWAVHPFPHPALFPLARRSLDRLLACCEGRFGIVPSEDWPGRDPWTAPTAWTAWAFAALSETDQRAGRRPLARRDRRTSLRLIGDLRRVATPLGLLPERVDARTGAPRSTTPLAWSHAFAILALRRLWPR